MNRDNLSHGILSEERDKLNKEILRRGTFRWWDPLSTPKVGQDRTSPLSLPAIGEQVEVTDHTYTIEADTRGSIEPTRSVNYPAQGIFPAGQDADRRTSVPGTSAAQLNVDEMKNFLVGLAKIQDINLYYGRDEQKFLAFRDPSGIYEAIENAQKSELNVLLHESSLAHSRNDPNGGLISSRHQRYPIYHPIEYPIEDGIYVMPSGEVEGEEGPLDEQNFFDDHGAEPGDGDFHPFNPSTTPLSTRQWADQDHDRKETIIHHVSGGTPSSSFGPNPRNPVRLDAYPGKPVYGGVPGSCQNNCTGLCYITCDNQCSESCMTTCWGRCGDACTSSCSNLCSGCSMQCFNSCKTKCENNVGYSCLHAGAKAVNIYTTGGIDGQVAENHIEIVTHSCQGCSYTCQFYPNKRTTCWDAACMGKCFISCMNNCSTSCFGGCIANDGEDSDNYHLGHGAGCEAGCTLNCVGICSGVCEGYCVNTCWHSCKDTCHDNCSWECETSCGSGCAFGCTNGCKDECTTNNGGSCKGGCEASCLQGCNKNCVGIGCRSICGIDAAGACEQNCRINCMAHSCTSLCADACSSICTSCVNTCGWNCGACSSQCSNGCEAECNISCTGNCEHSCHTDCLNNCTENCGGCTNLCYSCTGLCIGVCAFHCEAACTNCSNQCSWWCDVTCNRECFVNCDNVCIQTCSASCISFLMSETTNTAGPMRPPTAEGYQYPHPKNRWEERESFKLFQDPEPYHPVLRDYLLTVEVNNERNLIIRGDALEDVTLYMTSIFGGVFNIDAEGNMSINVDMLSPEIEMNQPLVDDGDGIIIAITKVNQPVTVDDIHFLLPIGFSGHLYGVIDPLTLIIVVERDIFLYPPKNEEDRII